MAEKQVKIIDKPVGIAKKLKGIKIDAPFNQASIKIAEKVMADNESAFYEATNNDFLELKKYFETIDQNNVTAEIYNHIYALAFSIKSRAATGGLLIASNVADSLYKFCDLAAKSTPKDGYKILYVHYSALNEIFSKQFAIDDAQKCTKLIDGLRLITAKYS